MAAAQQPPTRNRWRDAMLTPTSTIQQLLKHRTPGKAAVKLPNAAFHAAGERMALLTTFCDLSIGMGEVGNVLPMVYIHHQFKGTWKPSSNPVVPPDRLSCSDPLFAFGYCSTQERSAHRALLYVVVRWEVNLNPGF